MYGLTSAPQLLQMTKRSGFPVLIGLAIVIPRGYPARTARMAVAAGPICPGAYATGAANSGRLRRGGGHDLGHQLVQIVIGLKHDHLAGGAVAPVDQVLDALEVGVGPQVLAVLSNPVKQPPDQGTALDAFGAGQIHQLALQPVPRGEPFVLIEHLEWLAR